MQADSHAALVANSLPTPATMGQIALRSNRTGFNITVQIDYEYRTVFAYPFVMTTGAGDFMQRTPPKFFIVGAHYGQGKYFSLIKIIDETCYI